MQDADSSVLVTRHPFVKVLGVQCWWIHVEEAILKRITQYFGDPLSRVDPSAMPRPTWIVRVIPPKLAVAPAPTLS